MEFVQGLLESICDVYMSGDVLQATLAVVLLVLLAVLLLYVGFVLLYISLGILLVPVIVIGAFTVFIWDRVSQISSVSYISEYIRRKP